MHLRRTKIIATMGPASNSKEMVEKLIDTGVNCFRLNFSHGSQEGHLANIKLIREVAKDKNQAIGILADLQGPKIRVGEIENGEIDLKKGDHLTITTKSLIGNNNIVSTTYVELAKDVKPGDRFLLDDGLLTFQVTSVDINKGEIQCEVIYGGKLKSQKGINLPNVDISAPSLTESDLSNAIFAAGQDVDYFALSFVRRPRDIISLKELIRLQKKNIPVIAKIERQEALNDIDAIIKEADGIMVARGDLGVEIPSEQVPLLQKSMIRKCNIAGKPVITATQMLESMITNPRATRAEVSDVANAILDGTDVIMLSGETAVGKYPIEAVEKMVQIATEIEINSKILYTRRHGINDELINDVEENIAIMACETAKNLKAKAILAWTQTGDAIRLLSKFHPICPIFAFTTSKEIARRLELLWGVFPKVVPDDYNLETEGTTFCKHFIDNSSNKYRELVIITETQDHISKDRMNSLKIINLN